MYFTLWLGFLTIGQSNIQELSRENFEARVGYVYNHLVQD